MDEQFQSFICPQCHKKGALSSDAAPSYCPFCGIALPSNQQNESDKIIQNRYRIIENIGKGGMGEVLLVYDSACERCIALKRIRSDLNQHSQIQNRFLKEARITCQLTHPAIIPIYTIHKKDLSTFYTMPYVEGETLKQIIHKTKQQEKQGEHHHTIGGSIPALMRIFMTVCQAVAYAHSKQVIHRDLKLENIIVGKYGEVLILDWGLAKNIGTPYETDSDIDESLPPIDASDFESITRVGKVVGTIPYMAPEQALGHQATIQTDIYSLGVILYQILALRHPFKRGKTLAEFKKTLPYEKWVDPILVAPYREIPRMLSRVAQKSLSPNLLERYATVDEMVHDLENYMGGRSDWFLMAELDISEKNDWEFQENILLIEHAAITRATDQAEWVSLMVSRSSFPGNTRIETEVRILDQGNGIGFLLSIPETSERNQLNDGYCLWLGSDMNRTTKILCSNVEVMQAADIFLKRNQWYRIRIEKIEQSIHLYIDDTLQLSYIAHIPIIGTHVGLLARDADFEIDPLRINVGSLNIMVNCLAVPDAFLAHRDFDKALSEYRRIAYSFPDRSEGREAIFRAGLTFIEKAKTNRKKEQLLDQALQEFEKLHETPGAPLEYLGKALVYENLKQEDEEIKCFELAYRRYPKHPLLPILQEQIISRMHEVSRYHRIAAYSFIFLAVRHLPLSSIDTHTRRLYHSLQKHWEYLPFIEEEVDKDKTLHSFQFAIQLAFWLAKPYAIGELIDELEAYYPNSSIEMENAMFSLLELGSWKLVQEKIDKIKAAHEPPPTLELLKIASLSYELPLKTVLAQLFEAFPKELSFKEWRILWYCLNRALDSQQTSLIHQVSQQLDEYELPPDQQLILTSQRIWAYLLEKKWKAAGDLLHSCPVELRNKDSSDLFFLYGCWLAATEGSAMAEAHFSGLFETPYPRSWNLGSHFLAGNLERNSSWFQKAFLWEKRQLYRQLALYYDCIGDADKKQEYQQLVQQQFIYVEA